MTTFMERKMQREKDKKETTKTGFVEPKCLDKTAISEFMPWLLKAFEHFYGEQNIDFISTRIQNTIFFPYFSKSKNKEKETDEQLKILFNKLESIDDEFIADSDKNGFSNMVKDSIIVKRTQSSCSIAKSKNKGMIPIVLIDMYDKNFYPRLIHELIHAIDGNTKDDIDYSGFEKINKDHSKENQLFNEYITDKIAVDVYNYLLENGCPMLQGQQKLERNFMNSGSYWAPDIFMKDFYNEYKHEICECKLKNSNKVFVEVLGETATKKIMDSCDFIAQNFYFGASEEQMNSAVAVKDECKKIIQDALDEKKW